jgi:hypothetical protein
MTGALATFLLVPRIRLIGIPPVGVGPCRST